MAVIFTLIVNLPTLIWFSGSQVVLRWSQCQVPQARGNGLLFPSPEANWQLQKFRFMFLNFSILSHFPLEIFANIFQSLAAIFLTSGSYLSFLYLCVVFPSNLLQFLKQESERHNYKT